MYYCTSCNRSSCDQAKVFNSSQCEHCSAYSARTWTSMLCRNRIPQHIGQRLATEPVGLMLPTCIVDSPTVHKYHLTPAPRLSSALPVYAARCHSQPCCALCPTQMQIHIAYCALAVTLIRCESRVASAARLHGGTTWPAGKACLQT